MHYAVAELVIESRGIAPMVRSFSFSDSWSRLYRAEDYYLDMTCKPQGRSTMLKGQLMLESTSDVQTEAVVTLSSNNQEISRAQLDDWGQFRLTLEQQGSYELVLKMPCLTLMIPLEIN